MNFDFEKLFLAAPSPFVLLDRDLRMVWANEAYLAVTGRTRETLIGRIMTEEFPSDPQSDHGRMLRLSFKRVFETGATDHLPLIPYPIVGTDGQIEERYWSATHTPIAGADGRTEFVLQNTFDVTDLYRSRPHVPIPTGEQADVLRRAEAVTQQNLELGSAADFFQMAFNQAPSFMAILVGPDHVFRIANEAYVRIVGKRGLIGRSVREALPELEGQGFYELLDKVYRSGDAVTMRNARVVLQHEHEQAPHELFLDFVYQPLFDSTGSPFGIFVQGHDVTAQTVAEVQLREAEERFRTMAQTMPAHVWTALPDGRLDWLSERVHTYTGLDDEDLRGTCWGRLSHPDDRSEVAEGWQRSVEEGTAYAAEFRIRRADGEFLWHLVRAIPIRDHQGRIIRWVGTNADIDEQKAVEAALADLNATLEDRVARRNRELEEANAALRQSQKMEAIGNLSGGIAHDFNNLLQAITGSLTFAARELHVDSPGRQRLDAAMRAVDRGAALASQLLAFSRRQPLEPVPFDPAAMLAELSQILRSALGDEITLTIHAPEGLWWAFADVTNTENAILNLVVNSRDAMSGRGSLRIELANEVIAGGRDLVPGDYVEIKVIDDGPGMTPEIAEKVFEPFFTTKPVGKGTGLGLATVYGFARQSGGRVTIDSRPGAGTEVALTLPRSQAAPERREVVPTAAKLDAAGVTLLLVEDDADVMAATAALLRDAGFAVCTASDPELALEHLERDASVDLLVTDVVMPGRITTREMAERAAALRPDLPVLYISGYSRDTIVHDGRLDEGLNFLAKPFTQEKIVAKVHEILASKPSAARALPTKAADRRPPRILVCEDEPLIRLDLADILTALGAEVSLSSNAAQALTLLRQGEFQVLVTDVGLPDLSGEELARAARELQPELAIVFATGRASVAAAEAMTNCITLTKPFDDRRVAEVLERLIPSHPPEPVAKGG